MNKTDLYEPIKIAVYAILCKEKDLSSVLPQIFRGRMPESAASWAG
jgi:hypothetical protein